MSDWISAVCSSDLRRGVPPRTPTEVRPLPELGPGRIALGVLGDVRGARAGCVEAVDRGPVGPADAPVDVGDQAAHRETGIERLAQGQVIGAPRALVLRGEPLRLLVEVGVLTPEIGRAHA